MGKTFKHCFYFPVLSVLQQITPNFRHWKMKANKLIKNESVSKYLFKFCVFTRFICQKFQFREIYIRYACIHILRAANQKSPHMCVLCDVGTYVYIKQIPAYLAVSNVITITRINLCRMSRCTSRIFRVIKRGSIPFQ